MSMIRSFCHMIESLIFFVNYCCHFCGYLSLLKHGSHYLIQHAVVVLLHLFENWISEKWHKKFHLGLELY